MKDCSRWILRREFLKKGVNWGAVIAALPILQSLSFPASLYDFSAEYNLSKVSGEKLLEIAHKYGGEFGDVHAEEYTNHHNLTLIKED
jgi:hypothetical protein